MDDEEGVEDPEREEFGGAGYLHAYFLVAIPSEGGIWGGRVSPPSMDVKEPVENVITYLFFN